MVLGGRSLISKCQQGLFLQRPLSLANSCLHMFSPSEPMYVPISSLYDASYTELVCVSHSVVSDSLHTMDCSLPGSSVHGIFQSKILEWAVILFSRGSSQPRD